mmetsp:Transcript_22653/g.54214  ORF Transcript_22653/g.54214 Transcript_22653/m.54214 type:complete len:290 (-) Transcript_22653:188-1057(-)
MSDCSVDSNDKEVRLFDSHTLRSGTQPRLLVLTGNANCQSAESPVAKAANLTGLEACGCSSYLTFCPTELRPSQIPALVRYQSPSVSDQDESSWAVCPPEHVLQCGQRPVSHAQSATLTDGPTAFQACRDFGTCSYPEAKPVNSDSLCHKRKLFVDDRLSPSAVNRMSRKQVASSPRDRQVCGRSEGGSALSECESLRLSAKFLGRSQNPNKLALDYASVILDWKNLHDTANACGWDEISHCSPERFVEDHTDRFTSWSTTKRKAQSLCRVGDKRRRLFEEHTSSMASS